MKGFVKCTKENGDVVWINPTHAWTLEPIQVDGRPLTRVKFSDSYNVVVTQKPDQIYAS